MGFRPVPLHPFAPVFSFFHATPGLLTEGAWPYVFRALKTLSIVGACRDTPHRSPEQKHPESASEASWALQEKGKDKPKATYPTDLLSGHTAPTL